MATLSSSAGMLTEQVLVLLAGLADTSCSRLANWNWLGRETTALAARRGRGRQGALKGGIFRRPPQPRRHKL